MAEVEQAYQDLRRLEDQADVTRFRGVERSLHGVALADLQRAAAAARERVQGRLEISESDLSAEDARALGLMRDHVEAAGKTEEAESAPFPCDFEVDEVARGDNAFDRLSNALYACFGQAAEELVLGGETLARLTVLGRLGQTEDPELRRRLFYALEPIWRTVNRDNGPDSPYRRLIRLSAERLKQSGQSVEGKVARTLDLAPEVLEPWLIAILEKWREAAVTETLEPWDYWLQGGAADRLLDGQVPLESLRRLNDEYYRRLGADVAALGLQYDLEARPGKTPVAFTTFGRRNWRDGDAWRQGEFWIFATYREGGFGSLAELLHETGHGVHIAAIRTRPAFQDWPDNDTFTEALADLAALEIYEAEWQREFLGAEAPLADSLRSKYAPIALDVAWGLFEIRMHRNPDQDPNQLWSHLCERYLGVRPHPEISWWALRGQLVESPGYMLNYAVGAALIADVREKARRELGPFWKGNPKWYSWMSERLFRFGRERSSGQVLRGFLGREPSPQALLSDLERFVSPNSQDSNPRN